jgi:pimeloyl-ACP methyl ester carboxylesterase
MERVSQVQTPDGRILCVHEAGDPGGRPVVTHHGTPGSGGHYARHDAIARELGLRLIAYDRPGYGGSGRHPGRTVADAAADTAAILERFATWGLSGGGPHALACAALLPDRCAVAATIAGVAPHDAVDLDWLAGMGEDNVAEFGAAVAGEEAITEFLRPVGAELAQARSEDLVPALRSVLSDVDAAALTDALGDWLVGLFHHGLAGGQAGWIDDDLAFVRSWGFELNAITVPVVVWQGAHDLMVPPAHGRWLGAHVAGAELRFSAADGHLSLVETQMSSILAALSRYTF